MTGPPALLGVAASIGHKIAIAEANSAGGINGRKIKYVLEDDGYVTARTIQGVKKIIDVDKVFAMLGISGSGQSIAVMPLLEKSGIPTVIDVGPVRREPLGGGPRLELGVGMLEEVSIVLGVASRDVVEFGASDELLARVGARRLQQAVVHDLAADIRRQK